MKNANHKITLLFLFPLLLTVISQSAVHSSPTTKWEDTQLNLDELLNKGWQIAGHGTNRVAANSSSGNGFDVKTFTFLLTNKSGKYIICIIENPLPPVANNAGCRKLN
jgi:hypothetical protein